MAVRSSSMQVGYFLRNDDDVDGKKHFMHTDKVHVTKLLNKEVIPMLKMYTKDYSITHVGHIDQKHYGVVYTFSTTVGNASADDVRSMLLNPDDDGDFPVNGVFLFHAKEFPCPAAAAPKAKSPKRSPKRSKAKSPKRSPKRLGVFKG